MDVLHGRNELNYLLFQKNLLTMTSNDFTDIATDTIPGINLLLVNNNVNYHLALIRTRHEIKFN